MGIIPDIALMVTIHVIALTETALESKNKDALYNFYQKHKDANDRIVIISYLFTNES